MAVVGVGLTDSCDTAQNSSVRHHMFGTGVGLEDLMRSDTGTSCWEDSSFVQPEEEFNQTTTEKLRQQRLMRAPGEPAEQSKANRNEMRQIVGSIVRISIVTGPEYKECCLASCRSWQQAVRPSKKLVPSL